MSGDALIRAIDRLTEDSRDPPVMAFGGAPRMTPPPPPAPPPNPPTFAQAVATPPRTALGGVAAQSIFNQGGARGLVDQQDPQRKVLFGA